MFQLYLLTTDTRQCIADAACSGTKNIDLDQPLCRTSGFSSCAPYEFEDKKNFYQCTPCQHAIEGCNACTQDASNNVICTTCDSGL